MPLWIRLWMIAMLTCAALVVAWLLLVYGTPWAWHRLCGLRMAWKRLRNGQGRRSISGQQRK